MGDTLNKTLQESYSIDLQLAMLPVLSSLDVGAVGVTLPSELVKIIADGASLPVVVTANVSLDDERTVGDIPMVGYSFPWTEEARFAFTCATPADQPALQSQTSEVVIERVRRAVARVIEGHTKNPSSWNLSKLEQIGDGPDLKVSLPTYGPRDARKAYTNLMTTCDKIWDRIAFRMAFPLTFSGQPLLQDVKLVSRWENPLVLHAHQAATEFQWTISCVLPIPPESRRLLRGDIGHGCNQSTNPRKG